MKKLTLSKETLQRIDTGLHHINGGTLTIFTRTGGQACQPTWEHGCVETRDGSCWPECIY